METPIRFPSNGRRLFGILHEPEGEHRRVAFVFLNAGPQNRVGPHRIYVKTARRLCAEGVVCLRIDLPGVGESEGPFPAFSLDCYDPGDVRGAVDLLLERDDVDSVGLLGVCAGARVAIRAARRDPRVKAVVSWSAPIVSGPPDMPLSAAGPLSAVSARRHLRHWATLLVQPERWRKYARSTEAWREGAAKLRRVLSALSGGERQRGLGSLAQELESLLATPCAMFFAYGERDIGALAEFEERFGWIASEPECRRRLVIVPGGDHTFTSVAAERHLIAETLRWLETLYPGNPGLRVSRYA